MKSIEFRTNPMFLRNQFKGEGVFEIPQLKIDGIDLEEIELIGYDKLCENETEAIVHFFMDDYKFEVMWKDPEPRIEKLKKYKAVLSPDFSMYTEMPLSVKVYNAFRSRWCGAYMQAKGVKVIPTVSWGEPNTFWFCFDGIPKGSIVAVSTIGVRKEKSLFMQGYEEMMRKIKPKAVICYGEPFEEMNGKIITVDYAETNHYTKHFGGKVDSMSCVKGSGENIFVKKAYGYVDSCEKGRGSAINEWHPKKEEDKRLLGEPDTTGKYVNPNGEVYLLKYNSEGKAAIERHLTDHNQPWSHSKPHDHIINWDRGFPHYIEKIDYDPSLPIPELKAYKKKGMIIMKSTSKNSLMFESVEDFRWSVQYGGEVQFDFNGKSYCISRMNDGTIAFSQALKQETEEKLATVEELLDKVIDGKKLREIVTVIDVTDRTL